MLIGCFFGFVAYRGYAEEPSQNSKPDIAISQLPKTLTSHQATSLVITFSWNGEEDRFHLLIPQPKLSNLELLKVGQSTERSGNRVSKKFTFELEALGIGNATLGAFSFFYQPKEETTLLKYDIPETTIRVTKPLSQSNFIGKRFFGLIMLFIFWGIWKKRKARQIVQSEENISIESIPFQRLKQLKSETSSPADYEGLVPKLSQILSDYCIQKWGTASVDHLQQRKNQLIASERLKEISLLLKQFEIAKYSGEKLNPSEFDRLYKQTENLIRQN